MGSSLQPWRCSIPSGLPPPLLLLLLRQRRGGAALWRISTARSLYKLASLVSAGDPTVMKYGLRSTCRATEWHCARAAQRIEANRKQQVDANALSFDILTRAGEHSRSEPTLNKIHRVWLFIPEEKHQIRSCGGQRALEPRGKYIKYPPDGESGVSGVKQEFSACLKDSIRSLKVQFLFS